MRIVYCINNTRYSGGVTRVLANKANYFVENGYEVYIITTDQDCFKPRYFLSPKIICVDLGINYFKTDSQPFYKRLVSFLVSFFKHKNKLKHVLKDIDPDIVISTFTKDMYIIPFIRGRFKTILEIHGSRFGWLSTRKNRWFIGQIQNAVDELILEKYDKVVLLTDQERKYWMGLNNVSVIPNSNTFESEVVSKLNNKIAIAVGRYAEEKQLDHLIYAWKEVHDVFSEWTLHIIGDGGSLKEQLQSIIRKLGLKDSVLLKDPSMDIKKEYLKSSIYLMTSKHEGLGMVLLEAQVCGLPIVSYDCETGPLEVVENGENGFLVNSGDIKLFAKKAIKLIENESLRREMGRKSKLRSKNYSEYKVMGRWSELFRELVNT